jgi:hypothetical protein
MATLPLSGSRRKRDITVNGALWREVALLSIDIASAGHEKHRPSALDREMEVALMRRWTDHVCAPAEAGYRVSPVPRETLFNIALAQRDTAAQDLSGAGHSKVPL